MLLIPLSCLLLAGMAAAAPGALGLRGLYHVIDARTPGEWTYATGVSLLYQTAAVEDSVRFAPWYDPDIDTTLAITDHEHMADAVIEFGIGLPMNFEAALSVRAQASAYAYDQVFPRGSHIGLVDAVWDFSDVTLAGKYSYPLKDWLTTGGAAFVSAPLGDAVPDTAADYDGYWGAGDLMMQLRRPLVGTGSLGFGLYGLLTAVDPRYGEASMNLGFCSYGLEYEDPVLGSIKQRDNAIEFGLSGDYPTDLAVFFAEYWMRTFISRGGSAYSMPMTLMGGMRLLDKSNGAYLDLAAQIGFSAFDRTESDPWETGEPPLPGGLPGNWGLLLALGFDSSMLTSAPGSGTLRGTVTDAATGNPVAATISFPGNSATPVATDAEGRYTAVLRSGTIEARAEAEGYIPISATISLSAGATVPADFRLAAATPAGGTLTGSVSDFDTGDPLQATITIPDVGLTASTTSGSFSMEVPAGSWVVKAEAAGHAPSTLTAVVTGGQGASLDFQLRKALVQGQVMSFANIYFDSGSATLKTESYPVLDGIADLLKANTGARVEIGGHTDSDGGESMNQGLSERRAESVRAYLVQRGVPSSMLSTRGYGETTPVASNSTPEGKAQNRRIEFRVL